MLLTPSILFRVVYYYQQLEYVKSSNQNNLVWCQFGEINFMSYPIIQIYDQVANEEKNNSDWSSGDSSFLNVVYWWIMKFRWKKLRNP